MSLIIPQQEVWTHQPGTPAKTDDQHPLSRILVDQWSFSQRGRSASRRITATLPSSGGAWGESAGQRVYVSSAADSTQFLSIPDDSRLRPTERISVEALVRPTGWQGGSPYISGVYSRFRSGIERGPVLRFNPDGASGNKQKPFWMIDVGGSLYGVTGASVDANVWTHLLGTYDGAELRLYVNGVLAGTQAISGSITQGHTGPTAIGSDDYSNVGQNRTLIGAVSLVRVYSGAVPAAYAPKLAANPWQLFEPEELPVLVALGAGASYTDSLTDSAASTDSATTVLAALGAISDSGALTDTASSVLSATDALADSGALTDSTASAHVAVDALADSAAASDASTASVSSTQALADTGAATDSASSVLSAVDALTDSAAASETVATVLSAVDALADSAAATDSATVSNPQAAVEVYSGGWESFIRQLPRRAPPETVAATRKAVKGIVREAKRLKNRAEDLRELVPDLSGEQRARTEERIANIRALVSQYERMAAEYRQHAEMILEQQREDDDLEILLLAA